MLEDGPVKLATASRLGKARLRSLSWPSVALRHGASPIVRDSVARRNAQQDFEEHALWTSTRIVAATDVRGTTPVWLTRPAEPGSLRCSIPVRYKIPHKPPEKRS